MKIFSAEQIRNWDAYTIKHEPISSLDLMDRASLTFVKWFETQFPFKDGQNIHIVCGTGNNGGDGLAIARLLQQRHYDVKVYIYPLGALKTANFDANLKSLPPWDSIPVQIIKDVFSPKIPSHDILLDALLGSGLNRPLTGNLEALIKGLNQLDCNKIAVDIPSGMFSDQYTSGTSFKAHFTFSFEVPKLSFFFPSNQDRLGHWLYQSIGLEESFHERESTPFYFLSREFIQNLFKKRSKFSHKGSYGHALLIMGSYGKIGAALLAAKACLRTGAGLVSLHSPSIAYPIIQSTIPEVMVSIDQGAQYIEQLPDLEKYASIGIGCGLDTKDNSHEVLHQLLIKSDVPLLLDADALNILSLHPEWYKLVPQNTIITPHPKEFKRLFGKSSNDFERLQLQKQQSKTREWIIVLKGAHSSISLPNGDIFFNMTGNPGMATAGSGDVLSGIICALLAQGYPPSDAAILGVYLHGWAGDFAAKAKSQTALIASDLIEFLSPPLVILEEKANSSSF